MSALMSTPITRPVGPTARAARNAVEPAARAEVDDDLAGAQLGDRLRVAAAEAEVGAGRGRRDLLGRIAERRVRRVHRHRSARSIPCVLAARDGAVVVANVGTNLIVGLHGASDAPDGPGAGWMHEIVIAVGGRADAEAELRRAREGGRQLIARDRREPEAAEVQRGAGGEQGNIREALRARECESVGDERLADVEAAPRGRRRRIAASRARRPPRAVATRRRASRASTARAPAQPTSSPSIRAATILRIVEPVRRQRARREQRLDLAAIIRARREHRRARRHASIGSSASRRASIVSRAARNRARCSDSGVGCELESRNGAVLAGSGIGQCSRRTGRRNVGQTSSAQSVTTSSMPSGSISSTSFERGPVMSRPRSRSTSIASGLTRVGCEPAL